jgi:hypothetical protein
MKSVRESPYGSSENRITRNEWEDLDRLFQSIEPPAQNELFVSGDHYILYQKLVELGFRTPGDAIAVYRMAEAILLLGYDNEE